MDGLPVTIGPRRCVFLSELCFTAKIPIGVESSVEGAILFFGQLFVLNELFSSEYAVHSCMNRLANIAVVVCC